MYKVGAAKVDITCFQKGSVMLGYGRPFHQMKDVETPIYSRAIVIENENHTIAFVNVEIGFCTVYLKHGVLEKLKSKYPELNFKDNQIMITAQHTHSAGGGISQHFFYNVPTPGFNKDMWEKYRDGIADSIALAYYKRKNANLKFGTSDFSEKEEVAFNRSIDAYNANPEIEKKLKKEEWHLAADRTMKLLHFEDEQGELIASLNWFGTHCTSISNDKYKICSDNKGYAANFQEKHYQEKYKKEKTVCLFAQEACGDISPNFIYDKKKRWTRGKYKDDYESAKYTGDLQFQKARNISDNLLKNKNKIESRIEFIQSYIEFSDVQCDPEFTDGKKDCITSHPCLGISFLEGTVEGPGMAKSVGNILRRVLDIHRKNEEYKFSKTRGKEYADYVKRKYGTQSPKHIAVEAGMGKIAWQENIGKLPIPTFIEKSLQYIRHAGKQGMADHKPWILSKLPLQIFIIGELAIIGFPTEITTVAGRRLRKTLMDSLENYGIKEIILSPYANGYAGYVTTPEEYELQRYEGGHTLFGKWTLPAMQTSFKNLAEKLKNKKEDHSQPLIFSEDQIWVYK